MGEFRIRGDKTIYVDENGIGWGDTTKTTRYDPDTFEVMPPETTIIPVQLKRRTKEQVRTYLMEQKFTDLRKKHNISWQKGMTKSALVDKILADMVFEG